MLDLNRLLFNNFILNLELLSNIQKKIIKIFLKFE